MPGNNELSKGMQKVNILSLILISIKIDKNASANYGSMSSMH